MIKNVVSEVTCKIQSQVYMIKYILFTQDLYVIGYAMPSYLPGHCRRLRMESQTMKFKTAKNCDTAKNFVKLFYSRIQGIDAYASNNIAAADCSVGMTTSSKSIRKMLEVDNKMKPKTIKYHKLFNLSEITLKLVYIDTSILQ